MKTATTFGANALRWSVSLALGVGMTSTAGVAFAQDADADDEDLTGRVEVTGSRIKRADIEGALPVTVIDRNQIELSGETSVADLLRNTTFNSFGSFRPASGSSAQSWAGLSLRGLGEGRTLILIDGRRAPVAPQIGGAQDLNTIPLAAVERIEILSDGASAIYGTDAIGGVVNIITRKDFTGVQMTYGLSKPTQEGGDTEEGSILFGASSDRGSVMGGASFNKRDIVFQRDRPWSSGGASVYGNNLLYAGNGARDFGFVDDPVHGSAYPGACAGLPGYSLTGTGAGTRCVFDFTSVAADEASINNQAVFLRGNYRINDLWSTYVGAGVTRVKSFGRYAPVPDFGFIPTTSPNHPYANPASPYYDPTHPAFAEDLYVYHRYASLGNRDTFIDSNVYDLNVGFQGTIGMFDIDVGMRRNEFKYIDLGRNYLVRATARNFIGSGQYDLSDPFGNPPSILNAMKATISRESLTRLEELYAIANTDLPFEMSGGVVGLAFGAEYREEDYSDQYDSLSEAGQIGGSAGNSAGLGRDVTAMFFEVLLPVMPDLEVSVAGRHDKYSDYGSDFSPKISARWQPMDTVTLRASYGEGFAAPSLDLLSLSPSFAADFTTDAATCTALGLTPIPGENRCVNAAGQNQAPQVTMFVIANPNLGSEQSKQFSIGGAWDANEWLNLSLDYYNISIDNRIAGISLNTIINCLAGLTQCPPGVSTLPTAPFVPGFNGDPSLGLGIARDASGRIVGGQRGFVNLGTIDTSGVDLNVRTNFAFGGFGTLQSQLQIGYVQEIRVDGGANSVGQSVGGANGGGQPQFRAQLGNMWSYGDFSVVVNTSYVDSVVNTTGTGDVPSWTTHDVQLNYHTPWNGRLTVGVDNVGNKAPPLDGSLARGFDTSNYDPFGRVPYIRYTQTF
ncbi:MAG: TonB-dependent receptor [Gammaproteobacteria bacterium]